ncbi:MAG: FGGY-family carbohydrate kinase [Hyphomicrobiales bacterium]|nr:FGGY-family carbohydrate kinase [Hyphomicrobiales bacterium]
MGYLVGLDIGSGSIRAGAFAANGKVIAIASRPMASVAPDPNRPDHIVWPANSVWQNSCDALREVVGALPDGALIGGVAVACLGMDGLPLDAQGNELYDIIAWTDARCMPYYERWSQDFGEDRQFLTTGTPARGFSTLFRLQWMADRHPEILDKTRKWVLIGDYLNYRLCGALAIDYSMAASTLMFDPATLAWHAGIAAFGGVDLDLMCDPWPAGTQLGEVTASAAEATGLPIGTPVVLGGHDYLCGVLPVGGFKPGPVVNVGGTWDVIQTTLPVLKIPKSAGGTGWTVEPHVAPGAFSAFGAAIGGLAVKWFRETIATDLANDDERFFALAFEAAAPNAGSVMFLPHLAGATGPIVDPNLAGAFVGLRAGHTRQDLLSAVYEGLNFQTRQILGSLEHLDVIPEKLIFVGGSSRNSALVQSKADALNIPVEVPEVAETTCLGAAMLAGVGTGQFGSVEDAWEAMRCPSTIVDPVSERIAEANDRFSVFEELFADLQGAHHRLSRSVRKKLASA